MEPEATLQEVSVQRYTEKPFFSQWTGQKAVLFPGPEFIGIVIIGNNSGYDAIPNSTASLPNTSIMADDLLRMRRTIDDRTRLCQAGVAVTASSGENVGKG